MQIHDDEVAAALAAIRCYLTEEADAEAPAELRPSWRAAAVLDAQGLTPGRSAARASWAAADRASREGRWSPGIVGG